MRTLLVSAVFIVTTLSTSATWATDLCDVPKADWQPIEALQSMLVE